MLFTLVVLALVQPPVTGSPRYYFVLFAGQSVPFVPRTAHTWATFVKATPLADGTTLLEPITISWLPGDGDVKPQKPRAVAGKNHSLEETFAVMAGHRAQVSYWGPFEIDAERYERAAEQLRWLESGGVRYRVFDTFRRKKHVAHCVHAVTYADPVLARHFQPVLRVGEPGTSNLAAKYAKSGAFVGGSTTHDWVAAVLGIDQTGAIQREPGERIRRRWLR